METKPISADRLQTVWEVLNAALFDITEGNPTDAVGAIQECIDTLESMGIGS